ncbi:MAG: Smr/MutS family protein [Desulfurivibrionaceae bacterium]
MDKKKGKQPEFARFFDPEHFDEKLQTALREKGEKISDSPGTGALLHKVIDLHGHNAFNAERLLEAFFATARQEGVTKVSVITGKGIHSRGTAVLPDLAEQKMRELQADGVISSFHWEKGEKEISGKLIARLKVKS